ncbi:MAG: hypothetical protein IPN14_11855 [Bacteroidetes bacterium]|nr:hypothetical protein [Bacteroidota bacterium]
MIPLPRLPSDRWRQGSTTRKQHKYMIRIYLDWNVMSQIKKDLNSELHSILKDDLKYIKFYSTSHIGDILSSWTEENLHEKLIKKDLDFISYFTGDNCIFNTRDKKTIIDKLSPHILFNDQVEFSKIIQKTLTAPFATLLEDLKMPILANKIDESFNIPIADLNLSNDKMDSELSKAIDLIFPNLPVSPSLRELYQSFNRFMNELNEGLAYKNLRIMFQKGLKINRDRIYNSENPIKELEKHLKANEEIGLNQFNKKINKLLKNNTENWFDNYVHIYTNLDMAGFQEDEIRIENNKKQTYKNTTEDAFHAAFASLCDIYITNDKKSYRKTTELYKHFKTNTMVFTSKEFIEYDKNFLKKEGGEYYLYLIFEYIRNTKPIVFPKDDGLGFFSIYSTHFIFNYFNRIYVVDFEDQSLPTLLLSKAKPTNGPFIMYVEIHAFEGSPFLVRFKSRIYYSLILVSCSPLWA